MNTMMHDDKPTTTDANDEVVPSIKKRKTTNHQNQHQQQSSLSSTQDDTTHTQKDALQTIYNSLNGTNWKRQNNWLNDATSCEFQGISYQGSNVKILELSQNNLQGKLDDPILVQAFTKLGPSLEQLWMSENELTGNLPSVFANERVFPKLTIIDVGSNKLRGSLHSSFAMKRSVPFTYFDITDNQLTSYCRYSNISSKDDGMVDLQNRTSIISNSSNSPLPHVHVISSLLTKEQCAHVIKLAIQHTEQNGSTGWTTNRHKSYKTTDIDIAYCGNDILDVCNDHLRTTILPLISSLFKLSIEDLVIEDLFLAKYSVMKGEQSMLSKHVDDSELSFVITLNDEFKGGGTCFISNDDNDNDTKNTTITPNCGGGVFFCGHRLHSGVQVMEGIRYILAGFVRVYPSTAEGRDRLDCILKHR